MERYPLKEVKYSWRLQRGYNLKKIMLSKRHDTEKGTYYMTLNKKRSKYANQQTKSGVLVSRHQSKGENGDSLMGLVVSIKICWN